MTEEPPIGQPVTKRTTHDRTSLRQDLHNLGLREGDMVFAHSSFKSLGPVEGGAETVIDALEDAVGEEGLVLMPSFNLAPAFALRHEVWDHSLTPSSVGWITEVFRTLPGTHRSDHYSHSVAARGVGAEELVADHLNRDGPPSPWDRAPWGKTYGTQSPMYRAYEANGKLLMLGVGYDSSTYIHLVEVMYWQQLRDSDPEAKNVILDRDKVGAFWDREGEISVACVGDARCRLFSIAEYVDTIFREVALDPGHYRRGN